MAAAASPPSSFLKVTASAAPVVAEVEKGGENDRVGSLSQVTGVLGSQWGDEGKGKLVDVLAKHFDIVARCQVIFSPFLSISIFFLLSL